MSSVEFLEHHGDGTSWAENGTSVLLMNGIDANPPPPETIEKTVKCEWRFRHSGTSVLKRKWWRRRRSEIFRISGKLQFGLDSDMQRAILEAMATRNSLYEVVIKINIENIGELNETSTQVFRSPTYTDQGSNYNNPITAEDGFFIITDCSFTAPPGKQLFEYSITLERVAR